MDNIVMAATEGDLLWAYTAFWLIAAIFAVRQYLSMKRIGQRMQKLKQNE